MNWYKTAGHDDTRHGELLAQVRERLSKDVEGLKKDVIGGGPKVAQRFYGELRQRIIKLPPLGRIPRLSMSELEELSGVVAGIQSDLDKYGTSIKSASKSSVDTKNRQVMMEKGGLILKKFKYGGENRFMLVVPDELKNSPYWPQTTFAFEEKAKSAFDYLAKLLG